ncbi:MAG: YihY/virulence factor BrkB family protein [Betaproteobacteria bacterium]
MPLLGVSAQRVMRHPAGFAVRVVRGFFANQGLLLAGAVAYYALLSLVPLIILSVILLSNLVEQEVLIDTLSRYLEWLLHSQSSALLGDVSQFLDSRAAIGAVLFASLLIFSSLAFSVLEKAMAVIFAHRHATAKRHALVSAVLPYSFVLFLVVLLLLFTVLGLVVQSVSREGIEFHGQTWSLEWLSGPVIYLLGLGVETLIFAAIYVIMPAGRTRLRHALFGGLTAALLWEVARHSLVWYFSSLSKASIIYGSLTTSVVFLITMEIAATLLLFGAQVISEYEQIGDE